MFLDPAQVRHADFQAGEFRLASTGGRQRVTEIEDANRETTWGYAYVWEATTAEGAYLKLAVADLATGSRDVRSIHAEDGGQAFARLNCSGLRLTMRPVPKGSHSDHGHWYVVLRQAQILPGIEQWSRLYDAKTRSLSYWAGGPIGDLLSEVGGIDFGTRKDVYDEDNKRRKLPCVVFDEHDIHVPLGAFIFTRALPLLKGRTKPNR